MALAGELSVGKADSDLSNDVKHVSTSSFEWLTHLLDCFPHQRPQILIHMTKFRAEGHTRVLVTDDQYFPLTDSSHRCCLPVPAENHHHINQMV